MSLLFLACHWISDAELQDKLDPDGDGYAVDVDCAPMDPDIHPKAIEVCDGLDNDCDGAIDQDDDDVDLSTVRQWFPDGDGDGYGDDDNAIAACSAPEGYVEAGGDCDDGDAQISPGGGEVCNDVDDDCDGETDEADALDAGTWFRDADGDGFGAPDTSVLSCAMPEGFSALDTDCDDTTPTVNPEADEVCNDGVDNNCDDSADPCALTGELSVDGAGAILQGASGRFGEVLAAGDFDGDFIDDLAVSAPYRNGSSSGAVFVFYGPITGDLEAADGQQLNGRDGSDHLGVSMTSPGDLDGDGADDLLVGANQADNASGMIYAGAAWLITDDTWTAGTLQDARAVYYGAFGHNGAGSSVAAAGDRSGDAGWGEDGVNDVMVGAPDFESSTHQDNGEICLFSGAATGALSLQTARACLYGAEDRDRLGEVLAPLGDIDGDGLDDFMAGTPDGGMGGIAWLVTDPGRTFNNIANISGVVQLVAASDGDQVGASGAGVGDFNGDGHADVLVGAPRQDGGGLDAGAAYLISGGASLPESGSTIPDVAMAAWIGESEGDLAGTAVASAGDINGDGVADLLISSPYNSTSSASSAGRTYLIFGPLQGSGGIDLSEADASFDGIGDFDASGRSLTPAGDLNLDGLPDFAIGAPDADEVYIIFGLGL